MVGALQDKDKDTLQDLIEEEDGITQEDILQLFPETVVFVLGLDL